jgi:hypothetical protein
MVRFLLSVLIGLGVGVALGLYLGWEQFPVEYVDSRLSDLAPAYQEAYTLMIAAGFMEDADPLAAVERLSRLGVDNVPQYVQTITERYISNSRPLDDIRLLVTLAEGLGRLTPIMEPFRLINLPAGGN